MIYLFGDCHFSTREDWKEKVSRNIVKWFYERFESEKGENSVIFLGDIVDDYVNPGSIVNILNDLFNFCSQKFKMIYIITGNHDVNFYKSHQLENFLSFLPNEFNNIKLIEKVEVCTIESTSFIMMPHLVLDYNIPLVSYYSNYDWNGMEMQDFALGHFAVKDSANESFMNRVAVDVSSIPARQIICGHVHKRTSKYYIGSVYPCNPTEVMPDRIFMKIENKVVTEEKLPTFLEYREISYPEAPKREKSDPYKVCVYTVSGVTSEEVARNFYKGMYIKAVNILQYLVSSDDIQVNEDHTLSLKDMIIKFLSDKDIEMNDQVKTLVKDILSHHKELQVN